jgi:hypothetical protein
MKRISALPDAQKQLNTTDQELAQLTPKIRAATEALDFDSARTLKQRKAELEERQPRQKAIVLRLKFNEAERDAERLRQELSEKKRLQLEAQGYNTRAYDLWQETNKAFNLSTLDVAQAESRLGDANRNVIELGQQLEILLGQLAA